MSGIWGKAKKLRLVPAVIFIYDSARFFFLIALLAVFLVPDPEFKKINLPLMMFASPNALFPLMSFFLLIRFELSASFKPLYIIGKALCLLCVAIWLFFPIRQLSNIREILLALFLFAADLAAILGIAMLDEERPPESIHVKIIEGDE